MSYVSANPLHRSSVCSSAWTSGSKEVKRRIYFKQNIPFNVSKSLVRCSTPTLRRVFCAWTNVSVKNTSSGCWSREFPFTEHIKRDDVIDDVMVNDVTDDSQDKTILPNTSQPPHDCSFTSF
uniref:uncharacterized protein LOC113474531 n=1 Tax=Ciona intestinalis TaxID=7719 RepID=UPI000EF54FA7|nr:uncharacterized protein LOC113474531 [Ciona intestinalis]|eukprot:XP_026691730.1 uncharacterized protein LOC113474531 [Ciona intestinalis]